MASFGRLIRFSDITKSVYFGELNPSVNLTVNSVVGLSVFIYKGSLPWDEEFVLTDEMRTVQEILCPLPETPLFMCIGLNYKPHAEEAGLAFPEYPTVFIKPADALAGPFDEIPINCQLYNMDYEGELCFVIGKDCNNLTEVDDVQQYILGYTAGNDVSSRYWQAAERSGGQHGSGKWFDSFAPIGPSIVSSQIIKDPAQLNMRTIVNGELRQQTRVDEMIFNISAILQHLTRGLTLRRGTVVMTGTPSGVAAAMKPPAWLKNGDVVEIEIEGIGRMSNKFLFEQ